MLRVTPHDQIVFNKQEDEFVGTFDITNIDAKPITYKIKTTAPEKFRVRPSTGILQANGSAAINVLLQPGHFSPWNRDKFLVMCMALGKFDRK
jgi:MSP (Major sperm protein) domain